MRGFVEFRLIFSSIVAIAKLRSKGRPSSVSVVVQVCSAAVSLGDWRGIALQAVVQAGRSAVCLSQHLAATVPFFCWFLPPLTASRSSF